MIMAKDWLAKLRKDEGNEVIKETLEFIEDWGY